MNGKELRQEAKVKRHKEGGNHFIKNWLPQSFDFSLLPFAFPRRERGFTLLELMIVISIIVILATVALPQYQKATRHARETVLRDDLFQMRKLIDQYAADKGKLPESLEQLVAEGYLREVPEDPITGNTDWSPEMGEDPSLPEGSQGLKNIHSSSPDQGSDGRPYSEW